MGDLTYVLDSVHRVEIPIFFRAGNWRCWWLNGRKELNDEKKPYEQKKDYPEDFLHRILLFLKSRDSS